MNKKFAFTLIGAGILIVAGTFIYKNQQAKEAAQPEATAAATPAAEAPPAAATPAGPFDPKDPCAAYGGFKSVEKKSCFESRDLEALDIQKWLEEHRLATDFLGNEEYVKPNMVALIPEMIDSFAQNGKVDFAIELNCKYCWHQND